MTAERIDYLLILKPSVLKSVFVGKGYKEHGGCPSGVVVVK
jgi:hypothetical protein